MSWLDGFLSGGYATIQIAGSGLQARAILNFVSGVTGVDNPGAGRTDLTVAGGGGGTTVNGASVPAAGALVTGNVLQVSGASALTYAPVNLAGGAAFVTGALPTGNQAAQAMGSNCSGTTAACVVIKINGATVPAAGALTTGHVLQVSGASAATYGFVADANVAAAAAIAGTKIAPNFGSQNVVTTGTVQGNGLDSGSQKITHVLDGVAATDAATVAQTLPTLTSITTTTSATTTALHTIAIADDTYYDVQFAIRARDTTTGLAEWIDMQTWYRASGSVPTQLGTSKGPSPISNISVSTLTNSWVTVTQSSNNIVISIVTSNSSHVKFDCQVWVAGRALVAAV